ncbi:ABC transporter substrate-binding protein [Magnetococcales bacterium HHB-1]
MKKICIMLCLFLLPTSLFSAQKRVSVRLPIPIVEAGQTPFYVAYDQGYYSNAGLDVSFHLGSKELNPVKMVISGQNEFGVLGGPDTLLVARSKGHNIKAFSILHKNSNFPVILTLKSSGIKTPKDLSGKKIGFFYGHISTDVLRNFLRRQQIRYKEVDVGFDYSQLIAKKIDAEWAFRVTAGVFLPAKGVEINTIDPAEYGVSSHGYTIFATDNFIKKHPGVVLRFLQATLKGVLFTLKNPHAAYKSLAKRSPKANKKISMKRIHLYNEVMSGQGAYPAGFMNKEMFSDTYKRLKQEGVLSNDFNINDAFTLQFLNQTYHSFAQ